MKKKKYKIKSFIICLFVGFIISSIIFTNIKDTSEHLNNNDYNITNKENKTYDDVSILQYEDKTTMDRLKLFSQKDSRIKAIIDNYQDYPETILESLSRNIELTNFVLNYQAKKNQVYSDNVGSVEKGSIPLLLQYDERWGYGKYGNSNIAISGCGPTALAMVIAGLTGDNSYTPYKVGQFAMQHGYYLNGSGTTWALMSEGAKYFHIHSKEIALDKNTIYNALLNGHPIICSMRKGDFTINGHYIVLVGIVDNKIKVNDPFSYERSSILWDFERIKGQIKNLWEFY